MTWTLSDNGTTSALTLGTETTLATDTNNGTFVLEVDCSNMAAGDIVEARIYTKTLSGDSLLELWKATWYGVQVNPHKCSPPVASDISVECTLLQRQGTVTITSVTGSIPWGTLGTGQTTSATGIIKPPGAPNLAIISPGTATLSSSASTITSITTPLGFAIGGGWAVAGTNVVGGTTVAGITSATAVTTNQHSGSSSGAQTNITFTPLTTVVQMVSGAFNSTEAVYATTSSNAFTMNAAPTGRTFAWKMLRI